LSERFDTFIVARPASNAEAVVLGVTGSRSRLRDRLALSKPGPSSP
jgi:hypothetical protein